MCWIFFFSLKSLELEDVLNCQPYLDLLSLLSFFLSPAKLRYFITISNYAVLWLLKFLRYDLNIWLGFFLAELPPSSLTS